MKKWKIEQIPLMHSRIHANISYSFKKKIITFHASSNHSSYSTKSLKIIYKKKEKVKTLYEAMVIDLFTSRPSTRQWSSISLHQDPLQSNGHWFLVSHWGPLRGNGHRSFYIKTLCEAMVIDFLCHIEAFCEAMVIDLFTSRPFAR